MLVCRPIRSTRIYEIVVNKVETYKNGIYKKIVKRPLDIILALLAILLLSPLLLFLALAVGVKHGHPILFKQKRPGLNEEIFMMYKFRTMTDERNEYGELLPDSVRLTKFGRFLRSTSLDELPELFNILKGDMSFVGPRPQLVRDMVFMTNEQRKRHSVLPGLTGLAQVNGRNSVSWEEKLSFDIEYINSITFSKDLRILVLTVFKVLKRDGINSEGIDTAEDFGDYLLREKKINTDEYYSTLEKSKTLTNS